MKLFRNQIIFLKMPFAITVLALVATVFFSCGCSKSITIVSYGWQESGLGPKHISDTEFRNRSNSLSFDRMKSDRHDQVYLAWCEQGYLALTSSSSGAFERYKVELFDQCANRIRTGELILPPEHIPYMTVDYSRIKSFADEDWSIQWHQAIGYVPSNGAYKGELTGVEFEFDRFRIDDEGVAYVPIEPILWDPQGLEIDPGALSDEDRNQYAVRETDMNLALE